MKNNAEFKLESVIAAARSILDHESFEKSARAIFDRCCAVTGAVSGYVALLNEKGEENEVLFLEAGGLPCTVDPELPMPIRGLRAESYRSGKAVYHNDFMNSEWIEFIPHGHVEMRNVMFSPLNIEGKTVGIIGLANKQGDFTDADADIATVFGELAAISLKMNRARDLLQNKSDSLEKALKEVKTLHGLLPVCAHCKGIRNDDGYWTELAEYLTENTDARITHSLCPACAEKLYPEEFKELTQETRARHDEET